MNLSKFIISKQNYSLESYIHNFNNLFKKNSKREGIALMESKIVVYHLDSSSFYCDLSV